MKFAVQLYSVRDHIENGNDLLEILGKVKEIGFDGVEFAGYQAHLRRCPPRGFERVDRQGRPAPLLLNPVV